MNRGGLHEAALFFSAARTRPITPNLCPAGNVKLLISFLLQIEYYFVYLHIVLSEDKRHNILEYNKIL